MVMSSLPGKQSSHINCVRVFFITKRICFSCETLVGKSYLKIDRESGLDPRAATKYYCLKCAAKYFEIPKPLTIMLAGGSNSRSENKG